ncbi:MAG: thiolase family protein [Deltaproteobacteria bacterium]|nr:thiolase family protein [Deltaproteobacteria bacterium]
MRDVYVIGSHTIKFGRYLDNSIKELAAWTIEGVFKDAGIEKKDIQSAWFSNSGWGMRNFQHCIRGQVALRPLGIEGIPITNVENACAGGSTAFHSAWKDVASGMTDVSLAIGVEKVYAMNKYLMFAGFMSGLDVGGIFDQIEYIKKTAPEMLEVPKNVPAGVTRPRTKKNKAGMRGKLQNYWDMFATYVILGESMGYGNVKKLLTGLNGTGKGAGADHSPFMDVYAFAARAHMKKYGSTPRQLAVIASKNHWHSTMNPNAQYTFDVSVDDVLNDRMVSYPLTRAMCAPIGDGAASAILASGDVVKRLGMLARAVKVRASVLASGRTRTQDEPDIGERAGRIAYEKSGLGPKDIDLAEVHDATAYGELHQTEALGFFPEGEGGVYAERGETRVGGKKPINTSGGLLSRGHPIGASGLAQINELVTQLRGEAGKRQVRDAHIALAENGGGALGNEEAALCIHILEK